MGLMAGILAITILWALVNKISLLAILLYYAEQDIDLPDSGTMQKYTLKAAKKLFHIPS